MPIAYCRSVTLTSCIMATSESDDFESADEELNAARAEQATTRSKKVYNSIGSDSDDDVDYIPVQYHTPMRGNNNKEESKRPSQRKRSSMEKTDGNFDHISYLTVECIFNH